jgi:hypothetical protein
VRKLECLSALLVVATTLSNDAAAQDGHDSEPHAHGRSGGGIPGFFEPPEDLEQPDPASPPGTITVDLFDADNHPVSGEVVTLGALISSIAKGDSRKHFQATTNNQGRVVFAGLETLSNIAYRVSSGFQGGSFAALPFQLEQAKAMHVVLHVYPVTHSLQQAMIVAEATLAAEIRDDRIQLEEVLKFYNLGRSAWQPDNVQLHLPEGFTAFNTQASMSDQRVEEAGGGALLKGTFPPGQHTVDFRWQIPWASERDVDFTVGLPPHVVAARLMMPAAANISLVADGFPVATIRRDGQGSKFLVTERQLGPSDPKLTSLSVGIHGLPTPGPARLVATLLAATAVVFGMRMAFARQTSSSSRESKTPADATLARSALLDELVELERAHRAGDVGPKTYARARGAIVDALAHTLTTHTG